MPLAIEKANGKSELKLSLSTICGFDVSNIRERSTRVRVKWRDVAAAIRSLPVPSPSLPPSLSPTLQEGSSRYQMSNSWQVFLSSSPSLNDLTLSQLRWSRISPLCFLPPAVVRLWSTSVFDTFTCLSLSLSLLTELFCPMSCSAAAVEGIGSGRAVGCGISCTSPE